MSRIGGLALAASGRLNESTVGGGGIDIIIASVAIAVATITVIVGLSGTATVGRGLSADSAIGSFPAMPGMRWTCST